MHLITLSRGHRVEHRLRGCHAPGHGLEQLVQVLGVLGEEVAVTLHEALEIGGFTACSLCEHLVELGEHVLEPLKLLGR